VIFIFYIIFCINLNSQEIRIDDLKKHIEILSSDEFQGRKAGEKGADLAAEYIRKQFKEIGLVPITNEYFQCFNVVSEIQATDKNQLKLKDTSFKLYKDFIPLSFSSNSSLKSEAVFVGYGFDIKTKNIEWNDFSNVNVKGKWVIMLLGHPELEKSDSKFTNYSDARLKVLTAQDKGAKGIIFIAGVSLNKKDELISMVFDKSDTRADIPVINITRAVANYFISDTNKTIEKLESDLNKIQKPLSFEIPITLEATADVFFKKSPTCNVIGMLPCQGSDEYIVVGAHYDHLGLGGMGSGSRKPDTIAVHHGADDNASGVSAVIELARSLKTYEMLSSHFPAFKKNILFVTFSAEEIGILGSTYFVKNSPVDLKKIKAMFNFDMLGRFKDDRTILVGGVGTSAEADSLLDFHFKDSNFKISKSNQGFGPSDHAPFYAENIPVIFFSTGPHEDYHKPEDDISKINIEGEKEIVKHFFNIILDVVKSEKNLTFREAGPKTRSEKGRYKVTLGFMPEFGDSDKPGVGVSGVTKDSPAEMGGLVKGDRIIAIDGKQVKDIYEYMARLNKLEPGQTINIDVLRGDKVIVLIIHL
jgi:hypothetical protein